MTRKKEGDLNQGGRARGLTRRSNQAKTGGARLWNAGPRHTSGVKTQSRGLGWHKAALGGAVRTYSRAKDKRELLSTGCDIGFGRTTGVIVVMNAWMVEQQRVFLQPFLPVQGSGIATSRWWEAVAC